MSLIRKDLFFHRIFRFWVVLYWFFACFSFIWYCHVYILCYCFNTIFLKIHNFNKKHFYFWVYLSKEIVTFYSILFFTKSIRKRAEKRAKQNHCTSYCCFNWNIYWIDVDRSLWRFHIDKRLNAINEVC